MTLKSGTGQACAACKFQRRRCTPECLLAPFFPADQPKMFQNVHRLFGVKHVQNLLKELGPEQKPIAIKSIKFHAAMRDKHPVLGCVAEIQELEYKIHLLQEELHLVLHHLDYYRHHHQHQHQQQQQQQRDVSSMEDHFVSQLQLGVGPPGTNAAAAPPPPPPPPMQYDNYDDDIHMDSLKQDVVIDDSFWMQQNYCYDDNNNTNNNFSINININNNNNNDSNSNSMVVQSELSTSAHDYGEMHPFFENIDDTQSYIGSSFEPSERDSRQSIEQVAENELKSAAACFSLTSVN
ncbi:hypothetical protein ACP275_09G033400 [Erythranthe tilingii]